MRLSHRLTERERRTRRANWLKQPGVGNNAANVSLAIWLRKIVSQSFIQHVRHQRPYAHFPAQAVKAFTIVSLACGTHPSSTILPACKWGSVQCSFWACLQQSFLSPCCRTVASLSLPTSLRDAGCTRLGLVQAVEHHFLKVGCAVPPHPAEDVFYISCRFFCIR